MFERLMRNRVGELVLLGSLMLAVYGNATSALAQDRLKIGLFGQKSEQSGGGLVISATKGTYQQFGYLPPKTGGFFPSTFINGWTSCFDKDFGICTEIYTVSAVDAKMNEAMGEVAKVRAEVLAELKKPAGDTVAALKKELDAMRSELQLLRHEVNELKLAK